MNTRFFLFSYLVLLFILLLLPTTLASQLTGSFSPSRLALLIVDALLWLGLCWGFIRLLPRNLALLIVIPLLAAIIFLRFTYLGLINFSGAGFTSEFFLHLEWQSLVIAWQEYFFITISGLIATLLLLITGFIAGKKLGTASIPPGFVLVIVCGILIGLRHAKMPEGEFLQALISWHQPLHLALPQEHLEIWKQYPLVETDLISKRTLRAHTGEGPLNIIHIYLESVGQPLIDHPRWPGLMPNLKRLADEHSFIDNFYTSGYITIEGLVNSQCGTLFPFDRGGDFLTNNDGLADNMVCLGDVLSAAGYQLSYLGGANMAYVGKGDFLATHGFHNLKGGEYWASHGLHQRPNTWGVSDADLFIEARKELAQLRADGRPFNLTLLTIGTHLPGYRYEECKAYAKGKGRFLNALHCTDQLLAQWLEDIEADGHLEDTLVVITADHNIFPNPEMHRLFGEHAIEKRQLPLIILDPFKRRAAVTHGAAYDLPPTLLELAGVQHNALFALGRSLLDSKYQRDYFFKRYADVIPGISERHIYDSCDDTSAMRAPLETPLTPCQRQGLKILLMNQIQNFSQSITRLDCEKPALTKAILPRNREEPMDLTISGKKQHDRFTTSLIKIVPDQPGLYHVRIEKNAEIHQRHFIPQEDINAQDSHPDILPEDIAWLLIWRGDDSDDPPSWLDLANALSYTGSAALWLAKVEQDKPEWLSTTSGAPSDDPNWVLDGHTCNTLLAEPITHETTAAR